MIKKFSKFLILIAFNFLQIIFISLFFVKNETIYLLSFLLFFFISAAITAYFTVEKFTQNDEPEDLKDILNELKKEKETIKQSTIDEKIKNIKEKK